jgi:hypothetical protein
VRLYEDNETLISSILTKLQLPYEVNVSDNINKEKLRTHCKKLNKRYGNKYLFVIFCSVLYPHGKCLCFCIIFSVQTLYVFQAGSFLHTYMHAALYCMVWESSSSEIHNVLFHIPRFLFVLGLT